MHTAAPPFPGMGGGVFKCLALIWYGGGLGVVQAGSQQDSHCAFGSLCLWKKAASVVSPASCFKHHWLLCEDLPPPSHPAAFSIFVSPRSVIQPLISVVYLQVSGLSGRLRLRLWACSSHFPVRGERTVSFEPRLHREER